MENLRDKEYKELLKLKAKYDRKYSEKMNECAKRGLPYEDFQKEANGIKEALYFIDKYMRLKADPVVEYGKEWKGRRYEMDEFKSKSIDGSITDEDGKGYYATIDSKSDIEIRPSDVAEGIIRDDFTHVIWFEKQVD